MLAGHTLWPPAPNRRLGKLRLVLRFRALTQPAPLAPSFFILCAEGFWPQSFEGILSKVAPQSNLNATLSISRLTWSRPTFR